MSVNPPESYRSAVKMCGGQTCLTPVHRWSTSEDAPWAEVISAPRAMSGGQGAQTRSALVNAPRSPCARNSGPQSAPGPNAGGRQQTMAQGVRSPTPPATGKQRLGQAMANFGQSAVNRGLSPAADGNQKGTIPAKPTPACGYTPSTSGAPTKSGGQRVALKLNTGRQIFVAKPKTPELPKDAYGDDFPTPSVRETANRWGGGLAKRAGGVPPKEGGPVSLQSSPTGPPPKSAVPAKTGPMVDAAKVANVPVPKAAGADAASTGGAGGCDPIDSGITHPRPEVPPPRAIKSAPAGPSTQAKPCKVEPLPGVLQELPARITLSRKIAPRL